MNYLIAVLIVILPGIATAQEAVKPQPSPLAIASARYKSTYLKIIYSQPHKKGREIFGHLVPYGQVWRTGANEATELTITQDVKLNGTAVKAGTYTLFTIPQPDHWTIIVNRDVGLWGAYNYNSKLDVLRLDIPAQVSGQFYEPFTILIDQKNDKADIILRWDQIMVSLPVEFIEPKP